MNPTDKPDTKRQIIYVEKNGNIYGTHPNQGDISDKEWRDFVKRQELVWWDYADDCVKARQFLADRYDSKPPTKGYGGTITTTPIEGVIYFNAEGCVE